MESCFRLLLGALIFGLGTANLVQGEDANLRTAEMSVTVRASDGSYSIFGENSRDAVIHAEVAAEIDHKLVKSSDYPHHTISQSDFQDALGAGRQMTVRSTGLPGVPNLSYFLEIYDTEPFGTITVEVENHTSRAVTVQGIRSVQSIGTNAIHLGPSESSDRVLSDSFSEDWPPLQIKDLNEAKGGTLRGVGSQLIYNPKSQRSLFFGALTSARFLTILHLGEETDAQNRFSINSYRIDSTGTTEIQASDPESGLQKGPAKNLIELSLPVSPAGAISSERLMFAVGNDYYRQLDNYGAAIGVLQHSRVNSDNLLGWWSWTAYYAKITEGVVWTNAQWLAEHLKNLGYDYFHLDLGYGYARGEYDIPNASKFPRGMMPLTHQVCRLGLKMGFWTAPFEVSDRAWVYQHHKDWLVHNAQGEPIQIGEDDEDGKEILFVLDSTNPVAQEYLRHTYRTLVKDWGATYIKLDFMDNTAIEGKYYRPNTTALEAQRIGLKVIREAVGEHVLLDKDGSPMLNPVGIVDDGRVSQDTGHSFERSKEAAPGIAARYYMNGTFFRDDPDAFTVSRQVILDGPLHTPLTLSEAEVSIVLAAASGGMFEIGDDLPTLGADPDRVALLKNPDLLQMAKLGVAALPLDLLTYRSQDEQPGIFILHEDARQSMLAVFNWTKQPRSHTFTLLQLHLAQKDKYELYDGLNRNQSISLTGGAIELKNQEAHSVRLIKIIDSSVPAAPPSVTASVPAHARVGERIRFSSIASRNQVPALSYHWDFGDGVETDGTMQVHTYTQKGSYKIHLRVDGLDGVAWQNNYSIVVADTAKIKPPRRYIEMKN